MVGAGRSYHRRHCAAVVATEPILRRQLLAGLALGFVVVLVLLLLGDIRRVGDQLAGFTWALMPLILGCTLFNYLLRFFKWHYYLGLIGVRGLSLLESVRLFVAGFPLAVTPGKAGEALKGVWLHNRAGVPIARGVTVVLAERISDGLAVLTLSTLGVIAYPRYWPAFAAVLAMLLAVIVISQIRPLALAMIRFSERLPIIGKWSHHLEEFYEGAYALFRPRAMLIAVALGSVAWLGEGVGLYLVLLGLGVPAGVELLAAAVFVLSFSTVVGAVSTLPGGLGASEASIAAMLGLIVLRPAGTSAAATLLIRFATLWFGVALGLVVWSVSRDLLLGDGEEPVQE
jgi:uncharacterized protein (TIRG00374 family)